MSRAIKNVTMNERGSALVTVQWGKRKFVVEVSNEGVVVAPANKDGSINKFANPSVWVDPYVINDAGQLEDRDKDEAPLLVHTYFDNEQEAPVTVRAYKKRASLGGDGLPFVEKSE